MEPTIVSNDAASKAKRYVSLCSTDLDPRRTGNQLFNFAAMLLVARLTNRTIVLPTTLKTDWLDSTFHVKIRRMENDVIYRNMCPCYKFRERHSLSYDPRIKMLARMTSLRNKGILLCGFYQSWKYLTDIEEDLRRELIFRKNITMEARKFIKLSHPAEWKTGGVARIGVQVRRGDLLRLDNIRFGYTVPGLSYYRRAIQYFENEHDRVHLLVTSDDPEWARAYFDRWETNKCRASVSLNPAGVDLAILSMCDGVVMSTGTFGWWGAWLANKTTTYFVNWPRSGSDLEKQFKSDDFFPSSWKPLY